MPGRSRCPGDLVATFRRGETIATEVAVDAQIEVKLTTGAGGKPRLDVGSPTTYVDVLDEKVEGANPPSNAQLEAITSSARVLAVGSGAVGAIPLPTFGGIATHDVGIAEPAGYRVVEGNLQQTSACSRVAP